MIKLNDVANFHDQATASYAGKIALGHWDTQFTYTFENFFHPFIGELIAKLNRYSLPGMLDATWQVGLKQDFFKALYNPTEDDLVQADYFPKEIDVSEHGPYANYNWELFFHIPLTIAVHLGKNQRFAEAQRWFHYVFDPTSNDQSVDPSKRFWKFLAFRKPDDSKTIDEIVRILSVPRAELSPDDQKLQDDIMNGYDAIRNKPFQPHAVARTRHLAYQYCVVMKYLDNLVAWGYHLFQQDTVESINEAIQLYVLAAPTANSTTRAGKSQDLRATQEGGPRTDRRRAGGSGGPVSIQPRRLEFGDGRRGFQRAFWHWAYPLFLHPAQRQAAGLLGHRRRPALQDTPLHEYRGRCSPARFV